MGVPIIVNRRLWGMLGATSASQRLPAGTEARLAQFAGIAAAAISSAQGDALRERTAEQTALRRVAELVARGVDEQEPFEAVAVEAAGLINNEATTLVRFLADRTFVVIATCGGPASIGTLVDVPIDDQGTSAAVIRTRRPARLDDYGTASGPLYSRDGGANQASRSRSPWGDGSGACSAR